MPATHFSMRPQQWATLPTVAAIASAFTCVLSVTDTRPAAADTLHKSGDWRIKCTNAASASQSTCWITGTAQSNDADGYFAKLLVHGDGKIQVHTSGDETGKPGVMLTTDNGDRFSNNPLPYDACGGFGCSTKPITLNQHIAGSENMTVQWSLATSSILQIEIIQENLPERFRDNVVAPSRMLSLRLDGYLQCRDQFQKLQP